MGNGPFGYYRYRDDVGVVYRIRLRAAKAAIVGMVPALPTVPRLPHGITPRYFHCMSQADGRTLDFVYPVGNNTTWVNAQSLIFEGVPWRIIYKRGERRLRV